MPASSSRRSPTSRAMQGPWTWSEGYPWQSEALGELRVEVAGAPGGLGSDVAKAREATDACPWLRPGPVQDRSSGTVELRLVPEERPARPLNLRKRPMMRRELARSQRSFRGSRSSGTRSPRAGPHATADEFARRLTRGSASTWPPPRSRHPDDPR